MIKFFNKIRKSTLEEDKFGKYIKYAIGEIILVMVGILLALQVNTWNNNRQLEKEEAKILKSLHQEFSENLNNFDTVYNHHLNRRDNIEALMASRPEELSLDTLLSLNRVIGDNYTFDPFQGIYNSIINSGKIELVSNDSLKIKISKYQDLLNDYKEEEIGVMRFVQDKLYPYQLDECKMNFNIAYNIQVASEKEKIELKEGLVKLFQSDKYENIMSYVYGYMQAIFIEGPILKEEMVSIISILEKEIEKQD